MAFRPLLAVLLIGFSSAALAQGQPEAATGRRARPAVAATREMVVAAHPLAARAGAEILAAGGSAVDAAIAAALALGVVEPQSSGLGGGGFMLAWDQASRQVTSFDGRETAPAGAGPDLFLAPDGKPLDFRTAVVGGRSVGVPGSPRMLELAHRRFGRLPWEALFAPAIKLAGEGFPISPRLAALIAGDHSLNKDPVAAAHFFMPDGQPKPAGTLLVNAGLADTLRTIAAGGADAFYDGPIAADIAAAARAEPRPGTMTEADLNRYRAIERPAVCGPYRQWRVCSMGPASSGGVALLQTLALLERFDPALLGSGSVEAAHLFAEASRLAFADRDLLLADPAFVPQPLDGLLDRRYLAERSQLIDIGHDMGPARAGDLPQRRGELLAPGTSPEIPSTSHLVVVDKDGNAVSMTSSIEDAFGARRMVRGLLLNNELTDFSFAATDARGRIANAVEPGKRPRSSMSPTFVFGPDGRLVLAIGSAGGARIIGHVGWALLGILDGGLAPDVALGRGHVINRNGMTELEADTEAAGFKPGLEALGHQLRVTEITSGLHAIQVTPGGLLGAVDPRREGLAAGR